MTLRIDRAQISAVDAFELDGAKDRSADRRARNEAAGRCINENQRGTHGLATHGKRCHRCHLVARHGAATAHSMPEYKAAKPVFERSEASS